ncbi:MAG TPA: glycine betaine ABC transporter substrate-binding protein, partial [Solirubrobacteraceae bacterium]
ILPVVGVVWVMAATLAGCGASHKLVDKNSHTVTTNTTPLPGAGRPPVTIGDKNFTEQFVLGELYYEALRAKGFPVQLNQNIGPLDVTIRELESGQLAMYPEYLNTWDGDVAHAPGSFSNRSAAYDAGQTYAGAHGLKLLRPTPFSDTPSVGVTFNYAVQNGLTTISDLGKLGHQVTFGGPPEFQDAPTGLRTLESAYRFKSGSYRSLEIGGQYKALDQREVQAADVNTTDGQLSTGDYTLLSDPLRLFGWGNVVPVVSAHVLAIEGPAFAGTINQVTALLTTPVIRELNAQVDLAGRDPAAVAAEFLSDNGLE